MLIFVAMDSLLAVFIPVMMETSLMVMAAHRVVRFRMTIAVTMEALQPPRSVHI